MEIYNSEEEQVEALKRWWKENGTALVVGVVLGAAALLGYRGWDSYQTTQAEQASELYGQVEAALGRGDADAVSRGAADLAENFASTPYASLAALALARVRVDAGEPDAARAQLEWVEANSGQSELVAVAGLRIVRLLIDAGETGAALSRLDGIEGYDGVVAELRGDAHARQGEPEKARAAYIEALTAGASNQTLLQLKLDDLGTTESAQ